jgi:hypothetical protein
MNHRMSLIALGANTLVFAWLPAGCGDYDADDNPPPGGNDTSSTGGNDTSTPGDTGTGLGVDICNNVMPCGGDVVGTWNVTGACLAVSGALDTTSFSLGDTCSATVTGALDVSGTWTANADGTYTDGTTVTGSETVEMTADCKELSGTATTCNRLTGPFEAGGYATVECVDNATTGGCTATTTIDQAGGIGVAPGYPLTEGNYTTAGNTLTIEAGTQEYTYCVSGTTLTLTPVIAALTGTVTGSVVLQKQ